MADDKASLLPSKRGRISQTSVLLVSIHKSDGASVLAAAD